MKEEELKKEKEMNKHALFWAEWLHNTYENISKDQNWETQKECQVDFDKLPPRNKAVMLRIGSRLEIQFRMMKDKGFQAGQLASQERCLKIIWKILLEDVKDESLTSEWADWFFEELTKKVSEDER